MKTLAVKLFFAGVGLAVITGAWAVEPKPGLLGAAAPAGNQMSDRTLDYYAVTRVPTPAGLDPQVGGIAALADGRLAVAFHRGEVALLDPATNDWTIYAEGLHEPLGIVAESADSLVVMQRPELTRLRDVDGDGRADRYETVWDDFGMSGNYHEFAFGPVAGPDGKYYVALNTASNGAPVRPEIRGLWSEVGLPREKFVREDWRDIKDAAGRMYARVPWRGWVMQIDPRNGAAKPFASGFRSPDGLGFTADGLLLVNDNQGDWRGASEVHAVESGKFYGHPASLIWRADWDGTDPLDLPVERLEAWRTPPAIQFPFGTYGNSPTQMLTIPKTPGWGPFGGQVLMGEMNYARLFRLLPEQVDGVWQGACVGFIQTPALQMGLHRMAFVGEALYVGRTHLSWVGGEGISRVVPSGTTPFDPLDMKATAKGFRLAFTRPLAEGAADPAAWRVRSYRYAYHAAYGSPELDGMELKPGRVTLQDGGRVADVELPELRAGFVYDFDLSALTTREGGETPLNPRIAYTLHRIPGQAPAVASFADWQLLPGDPCWRAENGVLVGENDPALKGGMLWTKRSYRDFAMEFEARWNGAIDSGVMFRKPALQVQLGTSISRKQDLTGSFYLDDATDRYPEAAQAKLAANLLLPGQWNRFRIEARGDQFTVWINGQQAAQFRSERYAGAAPIGLQVHQHLKMKVEFRNVRIAEVR